MPDLLTQVGELRSDDPEFGTHDQPAEEVDETRSHVIVIVYSPKTPEAKIFRFALNDTVSTAAKLAAESFGYSDTGNPTFRTDAGQVLDRSKTLRAEHVRNREILELVDAGGGV